MINFKDSFGYLQHALFLQTFLEIGKYSDLFIIRNDLCVYAILWFNIQTSSEMICHYLIRELKYNCYLRTIK